MENINLRTQKSNAIKILSQYLKSKVILFYDINYNKNSKIFHIYLKVRSKNQDFLDLTLKTEFEKIDENFKWDEYFEKEIESRIRGENNEVRFEEIIFKSISLGETNIVKIHKSSKDEDKFMNTDFVLQVEVEYDHMFDNIISKVIVGIPFQIKSSYFTQLKHTNKASHIPSVVVNDLFSDEEIITKVQDIISNYIIILNLYNSLNGLWQQKQINSVAIERVKNLIEYQETKIHK